MFSMFAACTLLTHGCLAGRTVKLHDLIRKTYIQLKHGTHAKFKLFVTWLMFGTGKGGEHCKHCMKHGHCEPLAQTDNLIVCEILTLPPWLGQESSWPVATVVMLLRAAASWLQRSGDRCRTSIRLVMKKLFCNAATPFSGRMEVWRHTGHDSVRLWAGM